MTDAKRLLAEATSLPWEAGDIEPGAVLHNGSVFFRVLSIGNSDDAANETNLIVYAVNHLPDYLAAVEALDSALRSDCVESWNYERCEPWHNEARAALARLRDEVTA